MFRLTLIPFVLLFGAIIFGILSYLVIRYIKRILSFSLKKGTEFANQQKQKWAEKEQRKKLPDILQKGFDLYDRLETSHAKLPPEWKKSLQPIVDQAKAILDEVAIEGGTASLEDSTNNKKLNSIRPFFNHSLDALVQFTEKLNSDHALMNAEQIEKARQNINVFRADLLKHQETLKKARNMDFDVLMDVIKARLKK